MTDILIANGIVVTVDRERRVIDDGAVAIEGGRITEVGATGDLAARHPAARVIDASRKIVMPGLIDGHAHAGHGLVKTLGGGRTDIWFDACEKIYSHASSEDFWYAEALLSALERLKCGITCGVSLLGGGADIMRTNDPVYGGRHCQAVERVGIRSFLAVGPCRPPFPRRYTRWHGDDRTETSVSSADQLATCDTLIRTWHGKSDGRINICLAFPVYDESTSADPAGLEEVKALARDVWALRDEHDVLFTQDGHRNGSLEFAHEQFGFLGPNSLMGHSVDLSPGDIDLCRSTDTRIVHNPSAIMSIMGRCPVPELLDAGVTVMLGSDGTAPDRPYDMFRHMAQCMHYHRRHFRDPTYLPPGKVLEMATIDAARALGMEDDIGSLEAGKKADVILVDMFKPHLYPLNMPVSRLLYFANGADVDTVIVDGRILMENRTVSSVDEAEVLETAQKETDVMLTRADLHGALEVSQRFWGHSRL